MLARHRKPENLPNPEQRSSANKKTSPNIFVLASTIRDIVFRRNVILPRHNGGQTCFGHFSWHCDAAVDARRRRRKAGEAVSAVVDRDACEQRGLLWVSRRSVLTRAF